MITTKKGTILILIVLSIFLLTNFVYADYTEKVKEEVPESWFGPPMVASEEGIDEFNQSPILNDDVEEGKLPPVQERLPEDPIVVEPLERVGDYGGTMRILQNDLDVNYELFIRNFLFRPDPLGRDVDKFLAKSYSFSEDAKEFTITLREGIKFSDGEPLTADDIIYWWNAESKNEDLNPVSPENWTPVGWEKVEKKDDYTVKITFSEPNPLFVRNALNRLNTLSLIPSHYLKQYHPEYTDDKEQLEEITEDNGFEHWYQLYQYIKDGTHIDFKLPTLYPFVIKERTATSILYERNPYFPVVDTQGNQLPYLDNLRGELIQDWSIYSAKVSTGEADFAAGRTSTRNLTLYKNREKEENIQVITGQAVHTAQVMYEPNLTHGDPEIRDVIQNKKFRQALSMAIDRREINNTLFFGLAAPSAATVNPAHEYYDEAYQKYIEHDPERAKTLLDEINVVDQDGDGWRELPNGDSLKLNISFIEYGEEVPKILEISIEDWKEIGLEFDMRAVSWGLHDQRVRANNFDVTIAAFDRNMGFPYAQMANNAFVPVQVDTWYGSKWVEWSQWLTSDGENGIEPLENVKKLSEWLDIVQSTTDEDEREEYARRILESNAENVWQIGTVGQWPHPLIANDNLRNVVKEFVWGTNSLAFYPYYPEQLFFEGGERAQ